MAKSLLRSIFRIFSSGKKAEKDQEESESKSAADRYRMLRGAEVTLPANATPEKLCGITKGMPSEEIEQLLTQLYRRHNRAASSLDPKLREEAEAMLDAVVEMRMKYLAPADAKG